MNVMEISEKIENELKKNNLVGARIGSGYHFPSGERDVQYDYNTKNKDTDAITDVVESVAKSYKAKYRIRFSDEWFTFYISANPEL